MLGDEDDMFAIITKESAILIEKVKGLPHGEALSVLLLGFLNQIVMYRIAHRIPLEEIIESMSYLNKLLENIARIIDTVDDEDDAKELDWQSEYDKEFKDT